VGVSGTSHEGVEIAHILKLLKQLLVKPHMLSQACVRLLQQVVLVALQLLAIIGNVGGPARISGLEVEGVSAFENTLQQVLAGAPPESAHSRFEQDFERLELLGRGGFGEVWRCRHRIDGQEYAVKFVQFRANSLERDWVKHKVMREAKTLAGLPVHRNLIRYYNSWVEIDWTNSSEVNSRCLPILSNMPVSSDPSTPSPKQIDTTGSSHCSGRFVRQADVKPCVCDDESDGGVVFAEPSHTLLEHSKSECSSTATVQKPTALVQYAPQLQQTGLELRATLYIQTELCSKDTLQTWIAKRNEAFASKCITSKDKMAWNRQAVDIFTQCVAALVQLHATGCAHRDIKPANIFLGQDGTVQLGDFGLARMLSGLPAMDDESIVPLASHTGGLGTPTYASPEQLAGGSYGVEVDIYALGVVLAELICPVQTQMERAGLIECLRNSNSIASSAPEAELLSMADLAQRMTSLKPTVRPTARELFEAAPELCAEVQSSCDISLKQWRQQQQQEPQQKEQPQQMEQQQQQQQQHEPLQPLEHQEQLEDQAWQGRFQKAPLMRRSWSVPLMSAQNLSSADAQPFPGIFKLTEQKPARQHFQESLKTKEQQMLGQPIHEHRLQMQQEAVSTPHSQHAQWCVTIENFQSSPSCKVKGVPNQEYHPHRDYKQYDEPQQMQINVPLANLQLVMKNEPKEISAGAPYAQREHMLHGDAQNRQLQYVCLRPPPLIVAGSFQHHPTTMDRAKRASCSPHDQIRFHLWELILFLFCCFSDIHSFDPSCSVQKTGGLNELDQWMDIRHRQIMHEPNDLGQGL